MTTVSKLGDYFEVYHGTRWQPCFPPMLKKEKNFLGTGGKKKMRHFFLSYGSAKEGEVHSFIHKLSPFHFVFSFANATWTVLIERIIQRPVTDLFIFWWWGLSRVSQVRGGPEIRVFCQLLCFHHCCGVSRGVLWGKAHIGVLWKCGSNLWRPGKEAESWENMWSYDFFPVWGFVATSGRRGQDAWHLFFGSLLTF